MRKLLVMIAISFSLAVLEVERTGVRRPVPIVYQMDLPQTHLRRRPMKKHYICDFSLN